MSGSEILVFCFVSSCKVCADKPGYEHCFQVSDRPSITTFISWNIPVSFICCTNGFSFSLIYTAISAVTKLLAGRPVFSPWSCKEVIFFTGFGVHLAPLAVGLRISPRD